MFTTAKKWLCWISIAGVMGIVALPASFAGARPLGRNFGQQIEPPLSLEQKRQIRTVLQAHREEIRAQFEKSSAAHRAMADAVKASGPESSAARQAAEKLGDVARDRALLMAKVISEIRPILTPEQQKHLEAERGEFGGRWMTMGAGDSRP